MKAYDNYVAGINAYIAAAKSNPLLAPVEYSLPEPADRTVETDRRGRDRLAGRRHLRPRRRQRAELGADDGGDGRTDGGQGRRASGPGSTFAPRTTRKLRRRSRSRSPYETRSAFAKRGLALPEKNGVQEKGRAHSKPRPRVTADLGTVGGRLPGLALEAAGHASNWELVSAKNSAERPPDRGDGAAGRLLRAADPDGGGPARSGDRRPRRRFRRGRPPSRARPRARLRLERDDGDLRQRRHLRRGPLQGPASTTSTTASAGRWKS